MHRAALDYLIGGRHHRLRRPVVIRGARQVGKSHLVRLLAEQAFGNLVEID